MGMSNDAILFYGFLLDEDENPDFYSGDDWEDIVLERLGVASDNFDDRSKAIKDLGCSVGFHGTDGYHGYYVCVIDSEETAHRGRPKSVSTTIDPKWDDMLREFCMKTGVTYQEPDWYLASYYG